MSVIIDQAFLKSGEKLHLSTGRATESSYCKLFSFKLFIELVGHTEPGAMNILLFITLIVYHCLPLL